MRRTTRSLENCLRRHQACRSRTPEKEGSSQRSVTPREGNKRAKIGPTAGQAAIVGTTRREARYLGAAGAQTARDRMHTHTTHAHACTAERVCAHNGAGRRLTRQRQTRTGTNVPPRPRLLLASSTGGCVTPTLSSHRGNARLTGSLSAGAREEVKTPFVGLEREGRAMKSSHALLVREGGLSDVTRIPLAKESALRQGGRVDPEPHVTAQKKTLRKLNNNNSKLKLRFHSGPRGPDLS